MSGVGPSVLQDPGVDLVIARLYDRMSRLVFSVVEHKLAHERVVVRQLVSLNAQDYAQGLAFFLAQVIHRKCICRHAPQSKVSPRALGKKLQQLDYIVNLVAHHVRCCLDGLVLQGLVQ